MSIGTAAQREALATAYGVAAPNIAAFTSSGPGNTGAATNEVVGAPYSRQAASWGAATDNGTTATIVGAGSSLTIPAGTTVTAVAVAVSATKTTADVRDPVTITSTSFPTQGTLLVTPTFGQQ